jgi:tRNA dimethylallyltransferase
MGPGLIIIGGPTATGKSVLALTLAERLGSPILSADSRQVYREFDIGTAKPLRQERSRVLHELIDLVPPDAAFTLADYQQLAQARIAHYQTQGIVPLLVGGTGLYIRAITAGLIIPQVPPQPELRSQLANQGQAQCHAWLTQVDPASAQAIHPNDVVRTLRALEVYYVTGYPLSAQQGEVPPTYPILFLGVDITDPQVYAQRVQTRVSAMLEQGWLAEVEGIVARYSPELPLLKTLGYGELLDYLQGRCSLAQAEMAIAQHTRQFAKRQRTWFRANPQIYWVDPSQGESLAQCWQLVEAFVQG